MVKSQTEIEPLLISTTKAAAKLGISRSLFYELLASGRIPLHPIRLGQRRLWQVDKLKQWAADNCPANWGGK